MSPRDSIDDLRAAHTLPSRALEPSLRSIRSRLDELLRGDEELSAFLLDEFPNVYRELSVDMSRTRRVNILFEMVEPHEIQDALNKRRSAPLGRVAAPFWQKLFLEEYLGAAGRPIAFGGRAAELRQLRDWLYSAGPPYALVTGALGMGKSALVARFHDALNAPASEWAAVIVPLGAHSRIQRAEEILLALGRVLAQAHGREFKTESSRLLLSESVAELLARPLPEGRRQVIILDALDEVAEELCAVLRLPQTLPPGLRFVLTARSGRREVAPEALLEQLGLSERSFALRLMLESLSSAGISDVLTLIPPPQSGWPPHLAAELYRVTEGDPLLLQLYLRELVSAASANTLARLSSMPAGLTAYFERIWTEQLRAWAGQSQKFGRLAQEVLTLLSCTLGPLPVADLPNLLPPELDLRGFALEEALRPLGRWLRGDGLSTELMLTHPRLAEFFHTRFVLPTEETQYQTRIISYGQRSLADLASQSAPTSQVSSYLVRHLGEHLERARAPLPELLALVSSGWRRACVACHGHDGEFLNDLARVSKAAQAADQREIDAGRPARNLGARLRCLFFAASAASLAQGIPPELLLALVERAGWTIEHAASHARLIADRSLRVRALRRLTQRAQGDQAILLLSETLAAAESIEDRAERAEALAELFRTIPIELSALRDEILDRELSLPLHPAEGAAAVVAAYLPFLPVDQRQQAASEAAAEVHTLPTPEAQAHMLARLAAMVEQPLRNELIDRSDELAKRLFPHVSIGLIQYLPERQSQAQALLAITRAQQIRVPLWRAMALCELALSDWVPPSERPKLARAALAAFGEHLRAPEEPSRYLGNPLAGMPSMGVLSELFENMGRTVSKAMIGTDVERLAWNLAMCLPEDELPALTKLLAGHQWPRKSTGLRIHAITLARQGSVECEKLLTELANFDEEARYSCLVSLSPVLPVHRLPEALGLCRAIEDEADCLRFLIARIGKGLSGGRLAQLTEQIHATAPSFQAAAFSDLLEALPNEARTAIEHLAIEAVRKLATPQPRLRAIVRLIPLVECGRSELLTEALLLARSFSEGSEGQVELQLTALTDLMQICPAAQTSELVDEIITCLSRLTGDWQHRPSYYQWVRYASAIQRAQILQEANRTQSRTGQLDVLASLLPHLTGLERMDFAEQALKLCEQSPLGDIGIPFKALLDVLPKRLLARARVLALRMCQDRSSTVLGSLGRMSLLKLVELYTDPGQQLKSARELVRICQRCDRTQSWTLIELLPYLPNQSVEQRAVVSQILDDLQQPRAFTHVPQLTDMNKLAPFLTEEQVRVAFAALIKRQRENPFVLQGVQGLLSKLPVDLLPAAGDFAIACIRRAVGEELSIGVSKRVAELCAAAQSSLLDRLLAACATSNRCELLHNLKDIWPILESLGPPELAGQAIDALLEAQAAFT